ncbi:MAG TPA: hypothetical protein VF395_08035, partial [Polyangiaceae bacterium]
NRCAAQEPPDAGPDALGCKVRNCYRIQTPLCRVGFLCPEWSAASLPFACGSQGFGKIDIGGVTGVPVCCAPAAPETKDAGQ